MLDQILKQELDQPLPEQDIDNSSSWFYAYAFIIFLLGYGFYRLKQARKRKLKYHHKAKFIQKDKIVMAIEIKDFVVKYSEKQGYGFLPLNVMQSGLGLWESWRKKVFGLSHFYRPMFPVQKIKQFMFGLSAIEKVELMLYTSLEPEIAEVILFKLGIDRCFPKNMRKYCDLENHDDQKHAIEVDQDSRRVIIVTPTYDDHRHEDEKYFLVLRPKGDQQEQQNFLKYWLKELKTFVEANKSINNLHDELSDFKLNYDSQLSENQY